MRAEDGWPAVGEIPGARGLPVRAQGDLVTVWECRLRWPMAAQGEVRAW
jgi:hypothetical protein